MKIIILNGSPKFDNSVTIQSIKYLEQNYKKHKFEYINVVKKVKEYEKDEQKLKDLCFKIKEADAIVWAFPVYHALVHSNYKRFIELIFENKLQEYFLDKYTCAFSTSIHYADVQAHNYIRAICEDLGMKYVDYLSHEMNDLMKEKSRKELKIFFETFLTYINENLATSKLFNLKSKSTYKYKSSKTYKIFENNKKTIIITDTKNEDSNIKEMIHKYKSYIKNSVEVINLNDINIQGPCVGCCKCAAENKCIYDGNDDYRKNLDYVIKKADIIIFASTIKDRYLSSLFKLYYDRSFCYNHVPILKNKQVGYMISGKLSENQNLRQILEFHTQGSNLIGFITDEVENDIIIDNQIYAFIKLSFSYCENNYLKTETFLNIATNSVFTNAIEGALGGIFLEDFKYYKRNNLFNKVLLKDKMKGKFMRSLMGIKKFREYVQKNMVYLMIDEHKKILKNDEKK